MKILLLLPDIHQLTSFSNILHGNFQLETHVSKNAEYSKSSKEGRQRVAGTQDSGLLGEVVVEFVVRAKSNHATDSEGIGVEDLGACIVPYLQKWSIIVNNEYLFN